LPALSATALALVLASAFLHAVWSVAIKQSGDPLCFNLLQTWAACVGLAVVSFWIPWSSIPREVWLLLLVTGPTHALYIYWMSRAFELGDLSMVYPIARSTPAFMPFVAVPLLGEPLRPVGAVGIAIVVAGIWLVHAGQGWRWLTFAEPASRFAFLTLGATVAYSLIDKAAMASLADADWPSRLPRAIAYSLMLTVAHAVSLAPLVLRARGVRALRDTARTEFGRVTLAAGISFVGYTLILRALETSLVSYVVAVRQMSVLFAVALGVFWLREEPTRARVLGAVATVLGVALIARFG
jgi:drug/metabolite transporter (DMT)-like permease